MAFLSIRRHARDLLALTLLLCAFKKTTCGAEFPPVCETRGCEDDDATMTMS